MRLALACIAATTLLAGIAEANDEGRRIGQAVTVEEASTRLCSRPNCNDGEELGRVPARQVLKIEARKMVTHGMMKTVWYRVTYKGKTGWVSEWVTDAAPKRPRLTKVGQSYLRR